MRAPPVPPPSPTHSASERPPRGRRLGAGGTAGSWSWHRPRGGREADLFAASGLGLERPPMQASTRRMTPQIRTDTRYHHMISLHVINDTIFTRLRRPCRFSAWRIGGARPLRSKSTPGRPPRGDAPARPRAGAHLAARRRDGPATRSKYPTYLHAKIDIYAPLIEV